MKEFKIFKYNKIKVLFNGTDTDKFDPKYINTKELKILRNRLGINKTDFVLLIIKNFRMPVDFDIIIDALGILKRKFPLNFKLIFVGDGPKRQHMQNQIFKNNLTKESILVGLKKEVILYYALSHLSLIPYEPWCMETVNNAVFESLSMETPVLGFNFGALPEIFNEDDGVFTVPLISEQMANKIFKIYTKYSVAHKNAKQGREKIKQNFSIENWTNRIIEVYKEIIRE